MKIDLTTEQWNLILTVLVQRPYIEIAGLVDEIQRQARENSSQYTAQQNTEESDGE